MVTGGLHISHQEVGQPVDTSIKQPITVQYIVLDLNHQLILSIGEQVIVNMWL